MIWKVHISVSVDAHICVCLLMYINTNSLFICRGKNSPLCVGQCLDTLELPREVVEPSALETLVWVRALGSLTELWDWIGLCSSFGKVTGPGDLQRPLPALSLLYNISICSVLHLVWEGLETEKKVIFWLPWSIKDRLTPCPGGVALLSLTLVVGMCFFLLRSFSYELCS